MTANEMENPEIAASTTFCRSPRLRHQSKVLAYQSYYLQPKSSVCHRSSKIRIHAYNQTTSSEPLIESVVPTTVCPNTTHQTSTKYQSTTTTTITNINILHEHQHSSFTARTGKFGMQRSSTAVATPTIDCRTTTQTYGRTAHVAQCTAHTTARRTWLHGAQTLKE